MVLNRAQLLTGRTQKSQCLWANPSAPGWSGTGRKPNRAQTGRTRIWPFTRLQKNHLRLQEQAALRLFGRCFCRVLLLICLARKAFRSTPVFPFCRSRRLWERSVLAGFWKNYAAARLLGRHLPVSRSRYRAWLAVRLSFPERRPCAIGASLPVVLDWHYISRVSGSDYRPQSRAVLARVPSGLN